MVSELPQFIGSGNVDFSVRVRADIHQAIAQLKGLQLNLSQIGAAFGVTVRMGLAVTEVLGFAIDEHVKAMIQIGTSMVQQLFIAASAYASNPATLPWSITLITVATTLQVRMLQISAEADQETKARMSTARNLLIDLNNLILVLAS